MTVAFISSRIRELEVEREVAKETLLSMGFGEILMWEDIPGQSRPPKDVFLKNIGRSRIFIMILWKEFSDDVIEEFERAERKGIPILIFIKETRTSWGEKRDPRLQKFIDSISTLSWKPFRKMSEFRSVLKEAVMMELFEHLETPFLSHSHKDLYELGEEIASSAKSRLTLLARSLILITGPRPYISDTPTKYEKSHYDCLMRLFHKAKEGRIKFSCGYLIPTTVKELTDHPKIREFAKEKLTQLFNSSSMKDSQSLFTLVTPSPEWTPLFTFIVGDDRFAIWFKDPANPEIYSCISSEDPTIATALIHIFEFVCEQKPLNLLVEELQL